MNMTHAEATARGFTELYRASHGAASLDVLLVPGTDLDGEVKAWHPETAILLNIAGWFTDWERLEEAEGQAPKAPHGREYAQ